ncbi:MAG: EAL domain-containing protein [Lachnospiraceae bacterium]|jgi:diguanylate cyclase (GGDEF)-like protein|nr:EAL domain-containing protein [Lachnospiraceae bacterium]
MEKENAIRNNPITFGEIALALANDYESLYVIDSEDDSYVEYIAWGDNKELAVRSSGVNFYQDVIINCRELVHPEDQEMFLNSFKKETVTEVLKNGTSFSLNYRLIINGEPLHYFLKTIRGTDHKVIIGVQNIDAQRKRELVADEERRTYMHIAGALASRYEAIYYINVETNAYTQYSSSDEYAKLGTTKQGDDFFIDAADDIKKYLHPDDVNRVIYELEKDRLLRHLEEGGSMALTYRQLLGDRSQYVTMAVVHPKNDPKHIVMGVMNVDAQIRREQSVLAESKIFGEMALALAVRYEVIYHVNILTDEYLEYSASEKYARLEVGTKGGDFFTDSQENMKRDIYPEDLPMMQQLMEKSYLLKCLEESGKILVSYRLMLDGRPQFVTLFAVRPKEDSDHIIVGVENIDEAKRKEMEFERAIISATDMANKDALTGIKNKYAYANVEMELDDKINDMAAEAFAIAVCDINGLKQVNDIQGHSAGDEFIKNACMLICNTFKHSPVFRIGGDEFVVLLRGSDYENRWELSNGFREKIEENKQNGLVTLAYGISDYIPEQDMRVQDVFERADTLMYENKKWFKGELTEEGSSAEKSEDFMRFYILYEQLVAAMTDLNGVDVPRIERLLIEISTMFRLSKGVTRVYRNPQEERMGGGETLCCFDTGKEGKEIISLRVVTKVMSSATMTVYMSPDEKPLTEEERWKVELVMRTTLSFVSRNRLKDMVEELTYQDENGFPNFRSLNAYVMRELNQGMPRRWAFFHYNLRHFSLVNQEFGRDAGDAIMKKHFLMLQKMIGKHGYLIRLGGDNFICLCELEHLEEVKSFLTDVAVSFGDGNQVNLSAKAGIYITQEGEVIRNPSDFMEKIITAYRVAQSGDKDHFVYYDDSLLQRRERSMRVQQLFPLAIKAQEFRPFYQPKVNILSGKMEGAEALCRWFHDGRIVPPMEFIPMLEQTSDICKLDLYMLEHVCMDLRRWLDEGKEIVRVSVNFSRKNIMNSALSKTITEIVDRYQIPHKYIEIELTETTTDVAFSDLKRITGALHALGFYTSVDDFGVGFSSLNLIRDIPWNVLKIDRSFLPVQGDDERSTRNVMFRHVVSMARQLGLECIAEGVETEMQIQVLRENNCELAQGYFFDKPLPKEEFEIRLSNKKYDV